MQEYMEQNVQDSSKGEENDPSGSGQRLEQLDDVIRGNMEMCSVVVSVHVFLCVSVGYAPLEICIFC